MGRPPLRRVAPAPLALVLLLVVSSISYSALSSSSEPTCQGSPATILGTGVANHLEGTPGRDVILARGGADTIEGRGGPDLICAGSGADVVSAGGGEDSVLGGRGDDHLKGGRGPDTLLGGGGTDEANGGDGADVCEAETRTSCHLPEPEPSPSPSSSASASPSESPSSSPSTSPSPTASASASPSSAPPGTLNCITATTDQQVPAGDTADASDNQFDFGHVDISGPFYGTNATCTASGGSVTITAYSVATTTAPPGAAGFSWGTGSSPACPLNGSILLADGQSCKIFVGFGPSDTSVEDGYKGTLNVSHDGSNGPIEATYFEGTGQDLGGD